MNEAAHAADGFAAFISYSHADADAASKLQRRLERYRLPAHVARETGGASGSETRALGRIFRDREDLAAAPSLSDAIRDALSKSRALIVVCSPDARASRWVAEEIKLFRALHPERPVLPALVRGEPGDAFPDALSEGGLEPLAADLRKSADGWSLGFLKIVAGIAGVPLDTLVQRDAQRRVRRVTWITLGALTAMLAMGVMTAFAISARNEAARQRTSAEGLVEYMLTDLRDKLRGVGRIDVMDGVNQRAMEHYQKQGDLSVLPADSLDRRARILHAMGEDADKSGNLELAHAQFLEAHRATGVLLAREPENADRIFAHAQSEYWVGQAAWRKRDRSTTAKYWHAYADQAAKLLEVDKDKARANLEMGYALGNLCDLYLYDNYDLAKAIDHCERSIVFQRIAQRIAPGRTEINMALANRYGWLADAHLKNESFSAARSARYAEQQIVDNLLAKDSRNFELRFRRLWPKLGTAMIEIAMGLKRKGASELEVVAAELAMLSREAPDNVEVKRAWARAHYNRTDALISVDLTEARKSLAQTRLLVDEIGKMPGQSQSLTAFRDGIARFELQLSENRRK
ncbi:MAG: toll/interleukin-1 receptor domain-containing protein [Sphingorhabdus sp.]